MRRMLLAGAFAAGSLFVMGASPASATCTGTVTDIGGVLYFSDHGGGTWLYAETNGEPGLQRSGGSSGAGLLAGQPGFTDPCYEQDNGDTVIL